MARGTFTSYLPPRTFVGTTNINLVSFSGFPIHPLYVRICGVSKSRRKTWLIICGVWLGLHALLHLLLFPFLLYTGLCSLLMPFSLWILCSLTERGGRYLLLHLPPLLLCLAWWFVAPSLGLLFSLQWVPCVLMCGDILRQEPTHSPRLRCLLYAVAMLPFAALVPLFLMAWTDIHG